MCSLSRLASRLRFEPDGGLTIYPVGLERVPRRWKESHAGRDAPRYEPDDPKATEPVLIEEPLRLHTVAGLGQSSDSEEEEDARRASGA